MNLQGFHIDAFGVWSGLDQSGFSHGLNVFYGPNGSGKTTIARFLRAVLYGFDASERQHFLPGQGSAGGSAGGAVTVETPEGTHTIRRRDDGTPRGATTVESPSGAWTGEEALRRLNGGVSESVFRSVFHVGFRDLPLTESLVRQACNDGLEMWVLEADRRPIERVVHELDREARRLDGPGGVIEQLLDERRRLQSEVATLSAEERNELERSGLARRELDEKIAAGEQRLAHLRRQVEAGGPDDELRRREAKLAEIESQIERWRRVKADATARRRRLRDELVHWATDSEFEVELHEEPGRQIETIEHRVDKLQAEASATAERVAGCPQCGDLARRRFSPLVEGLRDEVYVLRRELGRRQVALRRDAIANELRQLRRCHSEVTTHLERLARRRDELAAKSQRERARLAEQQARRQDLREELRCCEAELANLLRRREAWGGWDMAAHRRRLAVARLELLTIETRLSEALERRDGAQVAQTVVRQLRQTAPQEHPSPILNDASAHLTRLTFGEYRRVRVARETQAVHVENDRGQWLPLDAISRGAHDLVHLSLTLALAAAYQRRGTASPLVLDDVFIHMDERTAQVAATTLRDYAAAGRQVLLFTCHQNVARLFRDLNVTVCDLPDYRLVGSSWRAPTAPAERVVEISLDKRPVREEVSTYVAPEPSPALSELTDEAYDLRDDKSVFHLDVTSPIEEAPGVDAEVAAGLRRIGVLSVGDLLGADEQDAAARLDRREVAAETVRRWQAMSRLVCSVPGLRAYDAKLLLAAGVSHPEELRRIEAQELLRRIERVLSTEEGRRIFRSGSDDELARVAGWVRAARSYRSLRERRRLADVIERKPKVKSQTRRRHESAPSAEESTRKWRFYLEVNSPIGDAPSVGPRTEERLKAAGIQTVRDLLKADPERLAKAMKSRHVDAKLVRDWQSQARLVCEAPNLRGHDAQILVACGVRNAERLAAFSPSELYALVGPYSKTREAERILRSSSPPDLAEVTDWIEWANHARRLSAA